MIGPQPRKSAKRRNRTTYRTMRHDGSYASKFAVYGCIGSLSCIAFLAAICNISNDHFFFSSDTMPSTATPSRGFNRFLLEDDPFSPCGDIFINVKIRSASSVDTISNNHHTKHQTSNSTVDNRDYHARLCNYAKSCDGEYPSRTFLPLILCHGVSTTSSSHQGDMTTTENKHQHYFYLETIFIYIILPPVLLLYLFLLFRLLATTADSYFSPALESFSFELGLPPRFAGATLLALGNGR